MFYKGDSPPAWFKLPQTQIKGLTVQSCSGFKSRGLARWHLPFDLMQQLFPPGLIAWSVPRLRRLKQTHLRLLGGF